MNSATANRDKSMVLASTREVSGDNNAEEIASAVNPVHSTHSSGREKVLEHIFLGDLLRALWRMGVHDVQVLRPEVDRNGYEFMLGHERIRRSVQLKSTYRGGKANEVTVNRHLENEPSGCVIWMMFDKDNLKLGRFLWLGGPPGEAMAELGGKVGRHTRATGTRSRRSGRTRASFQRAGFGGLPRSRRSRRRCSVGLVLPPRLEAAKPLTVPFSCGTCGANARSSPLPDDGDREWLERARYGEFSSSPRSSIGIAPPSSRTS